MSKVSVTLAIVLISVIAIFYYTSNSKTNLKSSPEPTTISNSQVTINFPGTEVIAGNLEVPWALAFLFDQSILFTERIGNLKLIKDKTVIEIAKIPQVKQIGEGGLLGVAVHPNFQTNHFIYLYYTYEGAGDQTLNRVIRAKFENNQLNDETIIVDKIPGSLNHNGGRIKFGPDKILYITAGDAQNPSLAQDKNSLAGKILRVTDDGSVEVYSYGHRNPQGLTWEANGQLWEVEHGQTATDEINLIEAGKNYGWPIIRGGETQSGMESPMLQSGNDTWAPGGSAYYNGSIFFGGLRGQALYEYKINAKELKTHFKNEFGRIRDVVLGPDNMLYITTSNRDGRGVVKENDDKIIRTNPKQL